MFVSQIPDFDIEDHVLAEDAGVGHHGAEHEEDAGQEPDGQCRDTLT